MSRSMKEDVRRPGESRADRLMVQLTCIAAAVTYLCLGAVILWRQPISHARLALGLTGVCTVSILLAVVARSVDSDRPDG